MFGCYGAEHSLCVQTDRLTACVLLRGIVGVSVGPVCLPRVSFSGCHAHGTDVLMKGLFEEEAVEINSSSRLSEEGTKVIVCLERSHSGC